MWICVAKGKPWQNLQLRKTFLWPLSHSVVRSSKVVCSSSRRMKLGGMRGATAGSNSTPVQERPEEEAEIETKTEVERVEVEIGADETVETETARAVGREDTDREADPALVPEEVMTTAAVLDLGQEEQETDVMTGVAEVEGGDKAMIGRHMQGTRGEVVSSEERRR